MSTTSTTEPVKKRRGRPPSSLKAKKNTHEHVDSFESVGHESTTSTTAADLTFAFENDQNPTTAAAISKLRRKLPSESLLEAAKQIGYRGISTGLHTEAIQRFGEPTVQKLLSVSCGDESIFYAYVQTFVAAGCTPQNPPPDNFATDHYWMLKSEERVQMLDEAFAIVDDDAELAKVEPGPFRCKKCGSNRILQTERQLRSGDEAATQFFKCAVCKNRWIVH